MTTLREAAQQALEALEGMATWVEQRPSLHPWDAWQRVGPAIEALRAALAEPEHKPHCALLKIPSRDCDCVEPVQEPVAWMVYTPDGKSVCVTDNPADFTEQHKALPLYASPPRAKPLTDEEIDRITTKQWGRDFMVPAAGRAWARAIERAHGITE